MVPFTKMSHGEEAIKDGVVGGRGVALGNLPAPPPRPKPHHQREIQGLQKILRALSSPPPDAQIEQSNRIVGPVVSKGRAPALPGEETSFLETK